MWRLRNPGPATSIRSSRSPRRPRAPAASRSATSRGGAPSSGASEHRGVGRVVAELRRAAAARGWPRGCRRGARRPRRRSRRSSRRPDRLAGLVHRWHSKSRWTAERRARLRRPRRPRPALAALGRFRRVRGAGDAARSGDERRGRAGEGGAEVVGRAALGADAGQQQDRTRHQLAQAGEEARLGRADDRSRAAELAGCRRAGRRARHDPAAIRSCSGPPPASRSSRSAAPGFEVRTRTKTPAPAAAAADRRAARASRRRAGIDGGGVGAEAARPRPTGSRWSRRARRRRRRR